MSSRRGLDPASSKYGSYILVLLGAIGMPLLATEASSKAGAVLCYIVAVLLITAGFFGFISCLKNEAVAEMRGLIQELQGQVARLQARLERRTGSPAEDDR